MDQSNNPTGGSRRGSWQRGKRPAAAAASSTARRREWTQTRRTSGDDDFRRKRFWSYVRRLGWSSTAAILIAVLLWLLLGMKRQVPMVAGLVSEYRTPLGPLAGIAADRRVLENLSRVGSWFDPGTVRVTDISDDLREADAGDVLEACAGRIAKLPPGGPSSNVALLYLACIGGVDAAGHACLVPSRPGSDASRGDEASWLRIDTLLDRLATARRGDTSLLVVLDASRPAHGEALGILDGGFAAALAADVRSQPREKIWVLSAAGPGQASCGGVSGAGTVFANAFAEGLEGAADAAPWGNADGRVGLWELAAFLGDEVDRRCTVFHGRRQTPFILPTPTDKDRDLALAWTVRTSGRPGQPAADGPAPAGAFLSGQRDWLSERWMASDRLRTRAVHERPVLWAHHGQQLLRAERLLGEDAGGTVEFNALKAAIESDEKLLSQPLLDGTVLPGLRLAQLAGSTRAAAQPGWLDGLEAWSRRQTGDGPQDDAPPAPPTDDPAEWLARVDAAWSRFLVLARSGVRIDRAAWTQWLALIGPSPKLNNAGPQELHVASLLGTWADDTAWQSATTILGRVAALTQDAAEATLPEDVRADGLVRSTSPLAEAHAARRLAFDLSIVGDDGSLARAAEQARVAAAHYATAVQLGQGASAAWQLLDRVRAELPWLAIWRAAAPAESPSSSTDSSTGEAVLPGAFDWEKISNAAATLERELGEDARAGAATIVAAQRNLEQSFSSLRAAYDEACDSLAERAAANATTLAAIRAVLSAPLVDGPRRMRLLEREAELATALAASPVPASRDAPQPIVPERFGSGFLVPWQGQLIHPLVAATAVAQPRSFSPQMSTADLAQAFGVWGASLRGSAAALQQARMPVAAGQSARTPRDSAAISRRFAAVFAAASRDRLLMEDDSSPVAAHLKQEWSRRLADVASDILDDFYGGVRSEDPPWFSRAANACLQEADRLDPNDSGRVKTVARMGALIGSGRTWASVDTVPERISVLPDQSGSTARSTLRIGEGAAGNLVPGEAAIWLMDAAGEPLDLVDASQPGTSARRLLLPVGKPDARGVPKGIDWRVDRNSAARVAAREGAACELVCWFRGHTLMQEIVPDRGDPGLPIVTRRSAPLPPRISVRGSQQRHGYVSFVFDCSGSMGLPTPGGKHRFDVGRQAFFELLQAMAKSGNWDASVWLYGHRTKWLKRPGGGYEPGLSEAGLREQNAARLAGRPFDLQPGMDVQRVLAMQALGPGQAREVQQLLNQLSPAGETPLYLAVRNALTDDRAAVGDDQAWRVVVVTDGANDQTGVQPLTTAGDVRDTLLAVNRGRAQPVTLDVLAFDLRGQGEGKRDLESLTKTAGGQFLEASDPETLLRSLRDFLQLARWEVVDDRRGSRNAEIGAAIELPIPDPATAAAYQVQLEGQPATAAAVTVTGGEGLELFTATSGRRLEHRRYDGGMEQGIRDRQSGLPDPAAPQMRWFVAGHLPKREGNRVRFPISFQNDDETQFSPRPVELWAEVRPESAVGSQPYVFTDLDFQPYRPVPVIDLTLPNWPRDAGQALISVWFSSRVAEPAATIVLGELQPGIAKPLTFSRLPDVSFDCQWEPLGADRGRLTVVEQHARGTEDLPRLRVRMEPECERSLHVVRPGEAVVRHEFDVTLDRGKPPAGARVTIVDRERLKEHCVGPAAPGGTLKPLRIPLPRD